MAERTAEAAELARALRLSVDSVGRYAREGRIPFDTTPGGHRRYNVDEVRLALGLGRGGSARSLFALPAATRRARAIRAVPSTPTASRVLQSAAVETAADELVSTAWRVQRSVPLTSA